MAGVIGAGVACLLATAVSSQDASAQIKLGRGAGGVSLGATSDSMLSRLGNPESTTRAPGPGGYKLYTFNSGIKAYTDERSKVFMLVITERSETTPQGIGVGTSLLRLKRVYDSALRCQTEGRQTSSCSILTTWRQTGGPAQTSTTEFVLGAGRKVARIVIFRGIG